LSAAGTMNVRTVAATAGVVTVAIGVAAGLTGVRRIAYGALTALVLAGLGPVLLVVGGLAALMAVSLAVGLAGGGAAGDAGLSGVGEGVVVGGAKLGSVYYRLWRRLRHPMAWGLGAGLVLGTALLWIVLGFYVIPRERRTLDVLRSAQSAIEQSYAEAGVYPATVPVTLDGFGRAISYQLAGKWKLASYTLSSLGFDGRPSDDDLCVTGGTRAGLWLRRGSDTLKKTIGLRAELAAIQGSRCGDAR
jgi:hypothetical protein